MPSGDAARTLIERGSFWTDGQRLFRVVFVGRHTIQCEDCYRPDERPLVFAASEMAGWRRVKPAGR